MNALPSPKPNRRKRLGLRFAVLVVAVSVLGAAYWFTRPPELVWWRSPEMVSGGYRVWVIIPTGWKLAYGPSKEDLEGYGQAVQDFMISPEYTPWPKLLRWVFPNRYEHSAGIWIHTRRFTALPDGPALFSEATRTYDDPDRLHRATRTMVHSDGKTQATIEYQRSDLSAFNRTYRQICNSLRIE